MRGLKLVAALAAAMFIAGSAGATTIYTDVVTPNWTYSSIQESSSYGDPEPLFGQPLGSGNDLVFFPADFKAASTGGGVDATGSHLQITITSNSPSHTIDTLNLTEFGDVVLAGFLGTGATGAQVSLAGFVTVLETTAGAISPVVIPFIGTYSPTNLFLFTTHPGTTLWSASISIDIESIVPDATKVVLSLDNDLFAASEATTSAKIQKKVVDGPAIVVSVPEPAALALLALGTLGLGLRARRA